MNISLGAVSGYHGNSCDSVLLRSVGLCLYRTHEQENDTKSKGRTCLLGSSIREFIYSNAVLSENMYVITKCSPVVI